MTKPDGKAFRQVYDRLFSVYGPQYWWPAETPFEVMVGAVLTQNTAWSNVEKAIGNLSDAGALHLEQLLAIPDAELAALIRPSGYFNIKTRRLKNLCHWLQEQGGQEKLRCRNTPELRKSLLSVNGIGPETADDILLYAFDRPVFVIDAYTRRFFTRLGLIRGNENYESLRELFEQSLPADVALYNEYHALIVRHAKEPCVVESGLGECCHCIVERPLQD